MKLILLMACVILMAACSRPPPESKPTWFQAPRHQTDRLLVKLRPGVRAALPLAVTRSIPQLGIQIIEPRSAEDTEIMIQLLRSRDEILWVERDVELPATAIPNDPLYSSQWYLPRIEAPGAWATTSSVSVTIAILDTGCDPFHLDLAGNMASGFNFYDNNTDTRDVYGHGTMVAGVAAAIGNNSTGITGVAWGARIMPLRIAGPDGYASIATIAQALVYAADHGIRVANISFGGVGDYLTTGSAAQYFQDRGGVITASSGNDGAVSSAPDNPYMLTVGASSNIDRITSWSNTGSNIDVAAPGTMLYVTSNGGGYAYFSGTSASAPVVAGIAALVIAANPALTGVQVQEIIKRSADDLGPAGWDAGFGFGRVNASKAVAMAGSGSSPTPTPTFDRTAPVLVITNPASGSRIRNMQTVSIRFSASDNVGVVKVDAYLDGNLIGSSTVPPFTIIWQANMLTRKSRYTLQAQAVDAAGNTGSTSVVVTR